MFELSICTLDDISDIANVTFNAFNDPFSRSLMPDHPEADAFRNNRNINIIKNDPYTKWIKITDTDINKVIACAKWGLPKTAAKAKSVNTTTRGANVEDGHETAATGDGEGDHTKIQWPSCCDAELLDDFYSCVDEKKEQIMGDGEYYCKYSSLYILNVLFVLMSLNMSCFCHHDSIV